MRGVSHALAAETEPRGSIFGSPFSGPGRVILFLGAALRLIVYFFLGPTTADDHYAVIEFVLRTHHLPPSGALAQSFHPPAFYLLSLPWALVGGPRFVEVFSLLLSLANLWLILRFLERTVENERARLHAMVLTALLPELVLWGIVVSNDSMAMLMGTLCLFAALRFVDAPGLRNAAIAGAAAGIGLFTKGTLLAHACGLLIVVTIVAARRLSPRKTIVSVAVFGALTLSLGSYKFIENQIRFGRPIVHGMEFGQPWVRDQQPTITSAYALVDLDLRKLLRRPYSELRQGGQTNPQSMPLLFYATFWHPYIPVSNFRGTWERTDRLAQATYLLAIIPTFLIGLGMVSCRRRPGGAVLIAFFALNVALVIAAGLRFDAWSCFQARLFFPCFVAIALGYALGIEHLVTRRPSLGPWVDAATIPLYATFAIYFAIELTHVAMKFFG